MGAVFARLNLLFKPHHFDLRWWKSYAYYFDNGVDSPLSKSLTESLIETRDHCYDSSGRYKGISLSADEVHIFSKDKDGELTDEFMIIKRMESHLIKEGYLERGSKYHLSAISDILITAEVMDTPFVSLPNMGGDTNADLQLSQYNQHVERDNFDLKQEVIQEMIKGKLFELLPLIRSQTDLEKCEDLLDILIHKMADVELPDEDTYGSLGKTGRKEKRTLYNHERF